VRLDDRTTDREPEPQTARLGRVERLEEAIEVRRRDSRTGIAYRHAHVVGSGFTAADQQFARPLAHPADGLDRVDDQVQHHLLHLYPIALDGR
jgi:hypothetical protein